MPMRKQIASRMLLLPEPLRPVMALKAGSNPLISVRWPYDLKPSITIDLMYIFVPSVTLGPVCAKYEPFYASTESWIGFKKWNSQVLNFFKSNLSNFEPTTVVVFVRPSLAVVGWLTFAALFESTARAKMKSLHRYLNWINHRDSGIHIERACSCAFKARSH